MAAPGLCYLLFNGTNWERELEIMAKKAAFAGIYFGAVAFNLPTTPSSRWVSLGDTSQRPLGLNIVNDGLLPPVKEHFWETKGCFQTFPSSLLGDVHLQSPSIKEHPALFF